MNLVPKNFRIFKLIIREDCSRILRKNLEAGGGYDFCGRSDKPFRA